MLEKSIENFKEILKQEVKRQGKDKKGKINKEKFFKRNLIF